MNYFQEVIEELVEALPDSDPGPIDGYALLVLTKGVNTTMEDVHHAWALWRNVTRPDHADLVPFDELSPETQEYDRKYMEAIHRVAEKMALAV